MLSAWEQQQLADLRYHWAGAYQFTICGSRWVAMSMMLPAVALTADSADGLRAKVRADYFARLDARRPGARPIASR